MEPNAVKDALDLLGRNFEEFKHTNDERLKQIESKGVADPLLQTKLDKLNAAIDEGQKALADHQAEIEAKVNKLALAGEKGDGLTPEQREHKSAFGAYLRKGTDAGLDAIQRKSMSEGSDPNGGYLVTADLGGRIVKRIYETSSVRPFAAVQRISTDALEGLTDLGTATATWVGETATRSATANPTFGRYRIPVHEMYAMPSATQILLDDASIDVEGWLAGKVADVFGRTENTAFVTGTGIGQPRGLTMYTTAATSDSTRAWGTIEHVATGTQASLGTTSNGADKLISLVAAMNPAYLPGARFFMCRSMLAAIRQVKNAQGFYVWQPDLQAGSDGQLLGFPITRWEDMPPITASTDTLSVAFANLAQAYQIVDRIGIRVLRDPFSVKGYVSFYTTYRVGGEVIDFNAVKFLKLATS